MCPNVRRGETESSTEHLASARSSGSCIACTIVIQFAWLGFRRCLVSEQARVVLRGFSEVAIHVWRKTVLDSFCLRLQHSPLVLHSLDCMWILRLEFSL